MTHADLQKLKVGTPVVWNRKGPECGAAGRIVEIEIAKAEGPTKRRFIQWADGTALGRDGWNWMNYKMLRWVKKEKGR